MLRINKGKAPDIRYIQAKKEHQCSDCIYIVQKGEFYYRVDNLVKCRLCMDEIFRGRI